MENTMEVNDQEILIKEYNGQRVVTHWNVAKLHNTTPKHIKNNFDRVRKYMVENVDYFLIGKQDDFVSTFCTSKEVNKKALNASKNIPLFTESGYLMITKSLTDDLSWQVQRTLVNCYFKVKEQMEPEEEIEIYSNNNFLEDMSKTLDWMDGFLQGLNRR